MAALILIVDDSRMLRRRIGIALKQSGYRIAEAGDGQEALERIAEERPAMIICDVNMPRMNGIEFLEALRERPEADVPVIMLTAENEPAAIVKAKQLGAVGWLLKPLHNSKIVIAIEHFVKAGA